MYTEPELYATAEQVAEYDEWCDDSADYVEWLGDQADAWEMGMAAELYGSRPGYVGGRHAS